MPVICSSQNSSKDRSDSPSLLSPPLSSCHRKSACKVREKFGLVAWPGAVVNFDAIMQVQTRAQASNSMLAQHGVCATLALFAYFAAVNWILFALLLLSFLLSPFAKGRKVNSVVIKIQLEQQLKEREYQQEREQLLAISLS